MALRTWAAAAAMSALWASQAVGQDFVTNGTYVGGYLTNYDPNGTFQTGLTFPVLTISFLVPVKDISFDYNQFGIFFDLSLNGIILPPAIPSIQHPDGWFPYSLPTGGPGGLAGLTFFYPYMNVGFGIDNLQYTRIDPIAVPGPVAGAGIPALIAMAGAWFVRRRRQLMPHQIL